MSNLELPRGGTMCLSKAGLAIASSDKAKLYMNAPNGAGVDFAINGTLYHKTTANELAVTAAVIQPALYTCLYLVMLSTSGTVTTLKGTQVLTAGLSAEDEVLKLPQATADTCPIGYFKVVTAGTATYTAATTGLNDSDVTTTYVDLMTIPPSPVTS